MTQPSARKRILEVVADFLRVDVLGAVRRGVWRAATALYLWASPETNPFLARAIRVEARRFKPLLYVGVLALLCIVINAGAWRLWNLIGDEVAGTRASGVVAYYIAAIGHLVGLTALVTAAVSAFGVTWLVQARANYLLRQEMLKNTLDQLQQLPVPEERWLWMMTSYSVGISIVVWLAGLPVYAIAMWTGQWSLLDIIGLLLVFVMLGHTMPRWTPLSWKMTNRSTWRQADWKVWQDAIREARASTKPGDSPGAAWEQQRRIQRAMAGSGTAGTGAEPSQAGAGQQLVNMLTPMPQNARRQNNSGPGLFLLIMAIPLSPALMMTMATAARRGVFLDLPRQIVDLLPLFPLTWPLILARFLNTPFPFFALKLPPLVLLIPLWLCMAHQQVNTLAANVSSAEVFWTNRRARKRMKVAAAITIGFIALLTGYGWPYLVKGGALSRILVGSAATDGWALAAGWTLAIVVGTVSAGVAIDPSFVAAAAGNRKIADAWKSAARSIALRWGGALLIYFGFCWLGGYSGWSHEWSMRFVPTVSASVAFLLADFGTATFIPLLSGGWQRVWRFLRILWFFGPPVAFGVFAIRSAVAGANSVSLGQFPCAVLSPFVTLFSLFRADVTSPVIVWHGVALQALIGAVCLLAGALSRMEMVQPPVDEKGTSLPERILQILLAPGAFLLRQILGVLLWIGRCGRAIADRFALLEDALLRWAQRWDNAVFTSELRKRLRREHWFQQWVIAVVCAAAIKGAEGAAALPFGLASSEWSDFAQLMLIQALLITLAAIGLTSVPLGQTFDRERANANLVFLFLTPMTESAILWGKLAPALIYSGGWLLLALPFLIWGWLLPGPTDFGMLAGTFCGALLLLSIMPLVNCVQLLFAVRAVKPTEGSGKGLLCNLAMLAAGGVLLGISSDAADAIGFCVSAILLVLLFSACSIAAWTLALHSLRRQRYGDIRTGNVTPQ